MSNFSYDDFAVLVRKFNPEMLSQESLKSLRIVPLSTAPSMAEAIKGTSLTGLEGELNLPKQKNGQAVDSNVEVQHNSAGYCRLVGHIEAVKPQEGQGQAVTKAKAFVLYHTVTVEDASGSGTKKEVIAVASLKEGFEIGDVCYPSFTITTVNNYQSVAFNPNAFATVEDLKNINGLDGLHIAFDTASGDLKLLDKDGNVLDQANLPIKTDVIIADGEEGYKYVKTDVEQDIHAAKAWMPEGKTAWETVPEAPYTMQHAALVVGNASTPASREFVDEKNEKRHPISTESVQFDRVVIGNSIYMVTDKTETYCNLLKVKGGAEAPTVISHAPLSGGNVTHDSQLYTITNDPVEVDVIKGEGGVTTYVLAGTDRPGMFQARSLDGGYTQLSHGTIVTSGGSSADRVLGITTDGTNLYTFDETAETPSEITSISGGKVRWLDVKPLTGVPNRTLKYGLEAFVWTVKGDEYKSNEPFFNQLNASLLALGFHEGDDIALGTNLSILAPTEGVSPLNGVDAEEYMHGKGNKATREQEVDEQRKFAKEELVAWNAQHPALTEDRNHGTIIDHKGLDVRDGSIILGCGRVGAEGVNSFKKINYGIQMKDRSSDQNFPNSSESLDFTISHFTGSTVPFDGNGHAIDLHSSTLLSIAADSYISGAPTCLILAEVTHNSNSEGDPLVVTPVRTTAGFSVAPSYSASSGLRLTLQDDRDNILSLLNPDLEDQWSVPAIIEVQAIYTHPKAETVPAQQMHTYIGKWTFLSDEGTQMSHPECRFLCNKIEEWMTAVGLADTNPSPDTNPAENVKLYVVIRVY